MRWLAVLAFVPVVAWGQSSYCTSAESDVAFADMTDKVLSNHRAGVGKRNITQAVDEITSTETGRLLWMAVVNYVYSRGDYASRQGAIAEARMTCIEITSGT